MLRTVIERAGFKELFESSRSKADAVLAKVPSAVSHISCDALFERPVQAELVELLILPKEAERFTSCVLVHGMGGTGKVSGLTIILSFVQIDSDFTMLDPDRDMRGSNPRFGSAHALQLHLLAGGGRGRGGR